MEPNCLKIWLLIKLNKIGCHMIVIHTLCDFLYVPPHVDQCKMSFWSNLVPKRLGGSCLQCMFLLLGIHVLLTTVKTKYLLPSISHDHVIGLMFRAPQGHMLF